jgi:hypothetical protein
MAGTLVPTFTFGPTGFVAPSGPAVLAGVQGDINAAFGSNLNYQLTTSQGQLASSWAASLSNTYATFQYYTQQVDPAYASGRMQDAIARIYFLERDPAEPTTLQVSCLGAQSVPINVGALIQDAAGNLYACAQAGVIPASGSIVLSFACTVPGPVTVPQADAVSIYQAVNGWDAVSVVSGAIGKDVESRAAFEQRRQDSVAGNSAGAIGSIVGAVSKVPNVLDYFGYSNSLATPLVIFGVTIPANSIYVSVAGGAPADVAAAIFSKKSPGCGMAGNTTLTVYDENPLYSAPIPYSITYEIPAALQIIAKVTLVNGPLIPADATTQVQNALVAAMTGQSSSLVPPPPRARIGSTLYGSNYVGAINALGPWAQVASLTLGSANTAAAVVYGYFSGNTFTCTSVGSGTLAVGQNLADANGLVPNGTNIVAFAGGSGGTGAYTTNNPLTVGGADFIGNGSGTNLTTSSTSGVVHVGDYVFGTGVPANTFIVQQISGTPGGDGIYLTNNPTTSAGATLNAQIKLTASIADQATVVVTAAQVPQIVPANITVTTT